MAARAWSSDFRARARGAGTIRSPCSTAARSSSIRDKVDLPNYGEFDEKRVFDAGRRCRGRSTSAACGSASRSARTSGAMLGVCETLAESGAEILLVPNGSPYYRGKIDVRHQVALRQVIESGLPLVFANQLGGQDELVFDGASLRPASRQVAGLPDEPVRGDACRHRLEATTARRLGLRRRADVAHPREGGGRLPRLHAGPARLREQERLQERRARPVGRHRFGDLRGTGRRCAGRGAAARRDDALSLHVEGFAEGRRGLRQRARLPLRRRADLRAGRGLLRTRWPSCSRAPRRASPRRTCRAARAARS